MHIRVKVCGIKDLRALEAAVANGADAVGVVFADSPRRVTPLQAAALLTFAPAGITRVAVFRRPVEAELLAALTACAFDQVQADFECEALVTATTRASFVPVFHDGPDLPRAIRDWNRAPRRGAGFVLVDGTRSGSGVHADWDRVAGIAHDTRVVLAGGLTPENVGEAIRRAMPWGVDVSSGVESRAGVKDPSRIAAFLDAVRAAQVCHLMEEAQ